MTLLRDRSRGVLLVLCGLCLALVVGASSLLAEPAAPTNAHVSWNGALPGQLLSTGAYQASGPSLAVSDDGQRVLVAFEYVAAMGAQPDTYYAQSTNGGQTWSAPTAVHNSAALDSGQVRAAFSANDVAHVVWTDRQIDNTTFSLLYSNNGGGAFSAPTTISTLSSSPNLVILTDPYVLTTGDNIIDVVWSEANLIQGNPDIFHSRSTNGGATWSAKVKAADRTPRATVPALAATDANTLHLLWVENDQWIYYSQGTVAGSITWSAPIVISTGVTDPRRPALLVEGGRLHVVFTRYVDDTEQYLMYLSCDGNCSSGGSWSAPAQISGAKLAVNGLDPFDLTATVAVAGGCLFAYFHGMDPDGAGQTSVNEAIVGVNECDNWSTRDLATDHSFRAIQPSLGAFGSALHLAYEQVSGASRQIYYRQGQAPSTAFVPIIYRK